VLETSEDVYLFSIVEGFYTLFYAARFARLVLMCDCILQMSENNAEEEGMLSKSR
jgi:predicted YcjX-like family ATPase